MTTKELNEYKEVFDAEFGIDPLYTISKTGKVENGKGTKNREAWHSIPWIHYWRALTGNHAAQLKCANCGTPIFPDIKGLSCRLYCKTNKVDPDDVQAVGGHFKFYGEDNFYIVPLCKDCNSDDVDTLTLKEGQENVLEVGATIEIE